jgi:hypothetical protein
MVSTAFDYLATKCRKADLFQLRITNAGCVKTIRESALKFALGCSGVFAEWIEGVNKSVVGQREAGNVFPRYLA